MSQVLKKWKNFGVPRFLHRKYLLDILYGMEFSRRYEENIALNSRYEKSGKNLLWRKKKKESD